MNEIQGRSIHIAYVGCSHRSHINLPIVPGDVGGGGVHGEEADHAGNLGGLAEPAQGNGLLDGLVGFVLFWGFG